MRNNDDPSYNYHHMQCSTRIGNSVKFDTFGATELEKELYLKQPGTRQAHAITPSQSRQGETDRVGQGLR